MEVQKVIKVYNRGKILGKHREHNNEPKDGETAKLKRHIRHLEKENKKLKSELRSYEKALAKNITFLKEKTNDLTLEELIKGANEELNLKQIKKESFDSFEMMKKKWSCYICDAGIMKFIVIPHGDSQHYFRKCSNPKCVNRTEAKELTEEVDKGL